jgi:Tol biopolymer transport system component
MSPRHFLRMADGSHIFVGRMAPTYGLWVIAQPGTSPKRLVTSPVPITTFAWKPDSRTIVYGGGAISTGELWQVTVGGNRTIAPFVLEGASDAIVIAPNGGRLAYVLQNLDSNIWRVSLGGIRQENPPPREKLFASVREETDAVISPDGKSIAFISNRSGHWNLWVGNADGSGLRSSRRNRFCHSIPRGRRTAARSPSIPRRQATLRSGSSAPQGDHRHGWLPYPVARRSPPGLGTASGSSFIRTPRAHGKSGRSGRRVGRQFS